MHIEASYSSEMLVSTHMTAKCHNPNERFLNLRSYLEVTTKIITKIYYIYQPGVKLPGREADHSTPPSAEVKKMWIYTSTPPYSFMT
jgi:hypothetical protein